MKYIREYKDFLLELRKVISDTSGSGRTKSIDWIHDDPNDAKSPSSGILLKQHLRDREFQDMVNLFAPGTPKHIVKKGIKKPSDSRIEKFKVTMNNLQFLKDRAKEVDELRCEYCNKGPLVIYDINMNDVTPERIADKNYRFTKFKSSDGATCDHKNPQSRGGDKFNYSNLAVCCHRCNKLKGNMSYEEWMQRLPLLLKKNEGVDNVLSAEIGDVLSESDIYSYVERIHPDYEGAFVDGDLGERIERFSKYTLMLVNIDEIDIEEFDLDEDKVSEYEEEFKNRNDYPPIVLDGDKDISSVRYKNGKYVTQYTIIDGTHRSNALNNLGVKKIKAWVGTSK